jgi:hypothetical protein
MKRDHCGALLKDGLSGEAVRGVTVGRSSPNSAGPQSSAIFALDAIVARGRLGLKPRAQLIHEQHSGTISEGARLVHGAMKGTIAMRTEYLAAIAIAVLAACTGLAVNSLGSLPREKQSTPAATLVADRLAESVDPFLIRSGG